MTLKLKVDENGVVEIKNDKPLYVDDAGKDVEVDANQLFDKVKELNGEAKQRRLEAQALKDKFAIFDEIEDVVKWKDDAEKAVKLAKDIDESVLIQAGKVDEVKANMKLAHDEEKVNMKKAFDEENKKSEAILIQKDGVIFELMVTSKFAQSPLFSGDKSITILPPEIAAKYFGHQFKVEKDDADNLTVVGYHMNGTQVYSRSQPGELAGFEEAIKEIIDEYPMKESIMRAGFSGSGGQGGGDGQGENELETLKKAYAEAIKNGQTQTAITLKNKIFEMDQKKR